MYRKLSVFPFYHLKHHVFYVFFEYWSKNIVHNNRENGPRGDNKSTTDFYTDFTSLRTRGSHDQTADCI